MNFVSGGVVRRLLHFAFDSAKKQTSFCRVVVVVASRFNGTLNSSGSLYSVRFSSTKKMGNERDGKFERLPQVAKPFHYKISLKTFLDKFTFEGNETIDLEVENFKPFHRFLCKNAKFFADSKTDKRIEILQQSNRYQRRFVES